MGSYVSIGEEFENINIIESKEMANILEFCLDQYLVEQLLPLWLGVCSHNVQNRVSTRDPQPANIRDTNF